MLDRFYRWISHIEIFETRYHGNRFRRNFFTKEKQKIPTTKTNNRKNKTKIQEPGSTVADFLFFPFENHNCTSCEGKFVLPREANLYFSK